MNRILTDELHIHLYGCLTASDVFELGKDRFQKVRERLSWYEVEYEKATGYRPDARSYWTEPNGFERLRQDFEFKEAGSFLKFQACFNLMIALLPIVPGDTTILKYVLGSQRAAGIRFGEYRFFLPPIFTSEQTKELAQGLTRAVLAIEAESAGSFTPRLIFGLSRVPEVALAQHRTLCALLSVKPELARAIVGIDFSGVEEGLPPKTLAPVLAEVHKENLRAPARALAVLYHVGESFAEMSLMSAARWVEQANTFGVHRLGHATSLGISPFELKERGFVDEQVSERKDHLHWLLTLKEPLQAAGFPVQDRDIKQELAALARQADGERVRINYDSATLAEAHNLQEALLKILVARGAVVESCPTSNFRIGGIKSHASHPLPRFLKAGIKTIVSTDDPGIFGISLHSEEALLRQEFALPERAIQGLQATNAEVRAEKLVRP